ncbi:uncharacterized protein LOC110843591 isoform X2 [Folsomia candida]|uniref:uncharacterized protein LOC110843591 isoform X2 n=1 Tax=Folsomia candida TaxID=158441 RepID=UPI000B904D8E|nr:uncharacterized protein LOC110843591 isoform X2 [Folsomia candida]
MKHLSTAENHGREEALRSKPLATTKYTIQWNHHKGGIFDTFAKYLDTGFMCDIALSCATEEIFISCHKLILAATSEYFEKIIRKMPKEYMGGPGCLILSGVKSRLDLESILAFIYKGKVVLEEKQIAGFLKAAELLRIKGIVLPTEIQQSVVEGATVTCMDALQSTVNVEDQVRFGNRIFDESTTICAMDNVEKGSRNISCAENPQVTQTKDRKIQSGDNNKIAKGKGKGKESKSKNSEKYKKYSYDQICNAINAVQSGMRHSNAAKKFGVPIRTLYGRTNRQKQDTLKKNANSREDIDNFIEQNQETDEMLTSRPSSPATSQATTAYCMQ